jgi:hypothetical protein
MGTSWLGWLFCQKVLLLTVSIYGELTGGAAVLDMQEFSGSKLVLSLIFPHVILHPEFEELGV